MVNHGRTAELVGLDVGFSLTSPTSGIARLCASGKVLVGNCGRTLEERVRVIGESPAQVVAIDAPLAFVPRGESRSCEHMTARGMFQRRCKPGFSHVAGTGRQLREAGRDSAEQMRTLASGMDLAAKFPRVVANHNIVEAFPNAFLGAALADSFYDRPPRRGKKFDWLYGAWVRDDFFSSLLERIGMGEQNELLKQCGEESHHEKRAALVCVLTAACVSAGRYTAVGDDRGGYFFLPPWEFWAGWAREEIDRQRRRLGEALIWIDGCKYGPDRRLPAQAS